ncbi:MAG: LysR family transcriptional regulator [Betaproteobacteria bacterium]|nr:MAG: LysR family transcriptional regulator [Betaproteobacteria bacterium]
MEALHSLHSQDLQLDWLRSFVSVVDAGSLTAAAPQLHRSQSALSMQLKKLEAAVGRPLLTRDARHLALTATGRLLLPHARGLLEAHHAAQQALHGPAVLGRVVLGVPDDYAVAYLAPVLRAFAARHPQVELSLVCEQSTSLVPKLRRGEIDLALATRDRAGTGSLLFREPLVWVAAAAHQAWRREPLPLALYEPGSRARKLVTAALAAQRRLHRVVYHSPSLAGQIAAAESGLAVAVLTRCSVPAGLMVLDKRHGLPALPPLDVVVLRSRASAASEAAQAMHEQLLLTLGRADEP